MTSGGRTVVIGLLLILASLYLMSFQGTFLAMVQFLAGGLVIGLILAGLAMLVIGVTDWRSARAESAAASDTGSGAA